MENKKIEAIYFDMDGTIADLYGQKDWLEDLRASNPNPYIKAEPMVDTKELSEILKKIKARGIKIGVISWLSMSSTKEYKAKVRKAKKEWLKKHLDVDFDFVHLVGYGTPKHKVRKIKNSIIIDDDERVLRTWHGGTIDAKDDWLPLLGELA